MNPDPTFSALITELRAQLPERPLLAKRDQLVNWMLERLKDAEGSAVIEFILYSLRLNLEKSTAFTHTMIAVSKALIERDLPWTGEQIVRLIDLGGGHTTSIESLQESIDDQRAGASSATVREMARFAGMHSGLIPFKAIISIAASIPMTPEIADALRRLRPSINGITCLGPDTRDLHARIDILTGGPVPETTLQVQGAWSQIVFTEIASSTRKAVWEEIFDHAVTSKSSDPSKKWLDCASALAGKLGEGELLECALRWLALGPSPNRPGVQLSSGETEYQKGFAWFLSTSDNLLLPGALARFAEGALKKIPMLGAVSQKVGNACVNVLAELPGRASVTQLSSLAQRIRYDTALRLIEQALQRAAQKAGISRAAVEEMSISDFGLAPGGTLVRQVGDYQFALTIEETTRAVTRWSDAQGKPLKSTPAVVKQSHPEELKELQLAAKEIEKTLSAQRSRIETLLLTQRTIDGETLSKYYLHHPLLSDLSRRLIWDFDGVPGIWYNGRLVDSAEREIDLSAQKTIRLWHPIHADPQTIFHWRCWLEDHGIRQPFKQAHREVYLITDAERESRDHSNRFAAHILRQHQFAALCEERGWTFRLMGQWDSHNVPVRHLPGGIKAEYEVDFPTDESAVSGHMIFVLIRSGSMRFRDSAGNPLSLESIPPVVFSEVMRDLDLFTGVTSIGADPAWGMRDGAFRAYCHEFSFGELSGMAHNRRSILERLLPRLSISKHCTLEDRFLKVHGHLADYRIHLNSGNILMDPGSRYLCIVEGGATRSMPRDLALPFEGDRVLALILSKAFLLADDHKIKDASIRSQLPPPRS